MDEEVKELEKSYALSIQFPFCARAMAITLAASNHQIWLREERHLNS